MGNNTTTSTTSVSASVSNPADNIISDSNAATNTDTAVEYFNYRLLPPETPCLNDDPKVEDHTHYRQGGFHPVLLGDVLGDGGRFRVVHKLGYGGFATVWLCHDNVSKKWRAVKILQAHASTIDCPDMKAIELFGGISPDVLAANGIQLPLEHFRIEGPNGGHLCFVLPLLGPKLLEVAERYCHVPELMKDVCFRLVMAMKFIHSQGLCHGDFRPDNILFRLVDGVDEWEEEAILKLLGKPEMIQIQHVDGPQVNLEPGIPSYLVSHAPITYSGGVCSSQIAVIDFGVSYPATQTPDDGSGIPLAYTAPEELFSRYDTMGFHTDIWALGVALIKVRLHIEPFANDVYSLPFDALEAMERIMGPIPEPYRSLWRSLDGVFINSQNDEGKPLDDDSWKDESVMATVHTLDEEHSRKERLEERGHANLLGYSMRSPRVNRITNEEAAKIANQAAADPGRMPGFSITLDQRGLDFNERAQYILPMAEVDQMFDLLMKIFRWQNKDRATLDQIADHEWFGDRNKQQQAAAAPGYAPDLAINTRTSTDTDDTNTDTNTNTHSKRARSPSLQPPAKRSKGGVEPSGGEEETVRGSGLIETAWESWAFYRGRVTLGLCRGTRWLVSLIFWGLDKIGRTVSLMAVAMRERRRV